MQMTDEQVWEDLSRFALAMKRGATVFFKNGIARGAVNKPETTIDFACVREWGGINEIIEPPQKKARPLNAEEWKSVAGCLLITPQYIDGGRYVFESFDEVRAAKLADFMATCHPPGFPNDIRKLWVEE